MYIYVKEYFCYQLKWEGYVDPENEAFDKNLALALGSDYIKMHTSGHCDMNGLRELLTLLNPKAVIPIHTDNPDLFEQLFSEEWNVIRLHDGDAISTLAASLTPTANHSI